MRLKVETPAGPKQVLSEHATVAEVGSEGGVFKELVFHKYAVLGVYIVIRSRDGLPREVSMTGASASVERTKGAAGGVRDVTANAEADVRLELSRRELHEAVRHESTGIHRKAGAAVSGYAVYHQGGVGAGLPAIVKHIFFECETDRTGSENVAELDAAKKAGVVGGIESERVPIGVDEVPDITAVLINVGPEVDGPVPTRPVNFRRRCCWRRVVLAGFDSRSEEGRDR